MTLIRTMLFVPGDRPDRIAKAIASGADCVVVDLEDAVALSAKDRAREGAVQAIAKCAQSDSTLAVRINALASGLLQDDLVALTSIWSVLQFVVLPMVPDAPTVVTVADLLSAADELAGLVVDGPRLIPLIETAQAVSTIDEIAAAHERIQTMAFGPADLANQLGVVPSADGLELMHARSSVVIAAAAAGLDSPIDGPWLNLDDTQGLIRSAEHARVLGFGGKQVIHPRQLSHVARVFATSAADLAWARRVDQAFTRAENGGVASIRLPDGEFVDYAVALRARALLERSR